MPEENIFDLDSPSQIEEAEWAEDEHEIGEEGLADEGESVFDSDITRKYLVDAGKLPILKRKEERALFDEYVKNHSQEVREKIIRHNLRLVIHIAKKYVNRGLDFLDLVQEGNIGLMTAVDKFEPERGFKFSTYATWWIKQAITRSLHNDSRTIRFPVHFGEMISSLSRFIERFFKKNGRKPNVEEVAIELGISEKKAREIMVAWRNLNKIVYLDQHVLGPKGDNEDSVIADFVENKATPRTSSLAEARLEFASSLRELETLKAKLARRVSQRDVEISLRYYGLCDGSFERQTLEKVGAAYGLTRERIRQIIVKNNRRLRLTDKQMMRFSRRVIQLSELAADISDMSRVIKTHEIPQTAEVPKAIVVSEPNVDLREKLRSFPIIDQKVFLVYVGLEYPLVRGVKGTALKLGFSEQMVERIVERVRTRLKGFGYEHE